MSDKTETTTHPFLEKHGPYPTEEEARTAKDLPSWAIDIETIYDEHGWWMTYTAGITLPLSYWQAWLEGESARGSEVQ